MQKFNNRAEVVKWFIGLHGANIYSENRIEPIFVSTELRKEILLSDEGVKFIMGGTVRKFIFKNLGGGVWSCDFEPKRD